MDYEIFDNFNLKSTKELLAIWAKYDNLLYKEETFSIIEYILKKRGITPPPKISIPKHESLSKRRFNDKWSKKYTVFLLIFFALLLFLIPARINKNFSKNSTIKSSSSFSNAQTGQTWIIQDDNVSVMKSPSAPSNKSEYMNNLNTVIGYGEIVKVIGTSGLYWKKVQLYNKGVPYASGWILSDTVEKAQITQ